jgi:hypothetical protein
VVREKGLSVPAAFAIRFWLPKPVHFTNDLHFVLTKRQTVQRSILIYNYTNHHNVVVNGLLKSRTTTRILQSTVKRIILPITFDNIVQYDFSSNVLKKNEIH